MLEKVFTNLISNYSEDQSYITSLWNEIAKQHSKKNRYYHSLTHLENIYKVLIEVKSQIKDWDIVLFSLFYHDYIYNVLKKDNEERSAQKAVDVLTTLSFPRDKIEVCKEMILATKGHQIAQNEDINYFTDADLAILGSDWPAYQTYFKNVRKEYKYYPDFMYNKGRIQVLKHFIQMSRIYKTDHFHSLFEAKAKENLQKEIDILLN